MTPTRPRWSRLRPSRARIRSSARAAVAIVFVAAGTLAGMWLALSAGGRTEAHVAVASLSVDVVPALDGHVTVYVPLVDWRVRMLHHRALATIELEVRGIDRAQARGALSSGDAANRSLRTLERQTYSVIEDAVRRAAVLSVAGGVIGALLAGGLVGAVTMRRRWLLASPVIGLVLALAVAIPSAVSLANVDARDVQPTAAGGHAEELPQVLRFAEQLLYVGDDYSRHYKNALDSIANLVNYSDVGGRRATHSAFVVSDIHNNVFVLDAFDRFAGDAPVFAIGDFGQIGARVEERMGPAIAALGGRVVAVSGNHDSKTFMRSLAREGATVLRRDDKLGRGVHSQPGPILQIQGLRVAGYDDPLERPPGAGGRHVLRVYGDQYERQVEEMIGWFDSLETRPDVLLVHQHGFAHRLVQTLRDRGDPQPLTIMTGHDHRPHVHELGPYRIIDGGTLGAGGPFAVGVQQVSFAQVHFRGVHPLAVDIVSVDPVSGEASARRTVLRGR